MKQLLTSYDICAWRYRLDVTQVVAAELLGMSTNAYRALEYRNTDRPQHPIDRKTFYLCQYREADRMWRLREAAE